MATLASLLTLTALCATPISQRDIYVDGLRIHVREAGPEGAPAVALLHGFMVSSATFEALMTQLSGRYRVIAYDAPGHGDSARPARRQRGRYTAAVAARVLEALELEQVIVVGQSMGAMTALQLAARWPGRVQHVIAVNPAGFSPGFWRQRGMRLLFSPGAYATGPALGYWLAARGSSMAFEAQSQRDLDEQLSLRRDRGWARAVASVYRTLAAGELDEVAPRVEVPVTLVLGEQDAAYPESYRARAAGLLGDAQVVRLPGCGHNVHHDAPARLVRVIDSVAAGERVPATIFP